MEIFFVIGFWIDLIWNMWGNLGRTGHRCGFFDFFAKNYAFQHTDPNTIANIIQNDPNTIIIMLAPTKYKQFLNK